MIKVIASDMDGTLLGDNHKVAPETEEAIREAQAAGIRFMIATGRSYNGAMEELKDLDLVYEYNCFFQAVQDTSVEVNLLFLKPLLLSRFLLPKSARAHNLHALTIQVLFLLFYFSSHCPLRFFQTYDKK